MCTIITTTIHTTETLCIYIYFLTHMFILKEKNTKIGWIVLEIWALYSLTVLQIHSDFLKFCFANYEIRIRDTEKMATDSNSASQN
jgi:hypothetical protein